MIKIAALVASVLVAITTVQHPASLKAGTHLVCIMENTASSATAKPGDTFRLRVDDPGYPYLRNSIVSGHVTRVMQSRGMSPAEIWFLFDTITFVNHVREPIRAYVVAANVTRRDTSTPAPHVGPPRFANAPGAGIPNPNTIVWQTQLGPKNQSSAQTGGAAYAPRPGVPLRVAAGTKVTIELASDLSTP